MGDGTGIEWTDATWNPIVGCSIHSPGCTNCYAMRQAARIERMTPSTHYAGTTQPSKAGPVWTGKLALAPDHILTQPLRWSRPRNIFANSMGDVFHEDAPDEWIDRTFAVMALTPHHTYQVLTKRDERMRGYFAELDALAARRRDFLERYRTIGSCSGLWLPTWPLPNVLLGVSVEDQRRADERREHLAALAKAGWRTFVSYEPALGPVDWSGWEFLSWLICGFESGPNARPGHPDWARIARDFCAAHGIPFFFKQWGEWAPGNWAFDLDDHLCFEPDDERVPVKGLNLPGADDRMIWSEGDRQPEGRGFLKVGKRAAGRLLDGIEHNGMPEVRP